MTKHMTIREQLSYLAFVVGYWVVATATVFAAIVAFVPAN